MGIADTFSEAYSKALYAAGTHLPENGTVLLSVNRQDYDRAAEIARRLQAIGFEIMATRGTQAMLKDHGLESKFVYKVNEGRPNTVDCMKNQEVQLVINTPLGQESHFDERVIGETAYRMGLPLITTLSAAEAAVGAISAIKDKPLQPLCLQELNHS
jgi:carbamoyl-phosphate synthase large subunit